MVTPLSVLGLVEETMYYETFNVYACSGHRSLKGKTCRIEEVDTSDMWLLQAGHCFKDQVMQPWRNESKPERSIPKVQFQDGNLDTLLRLLRQGPGYPPVPAVR